MSPAPDCSYQPILSFNNWCRPPGWWEVLVWADGPRPHPRHPGADIWGHHRGQTDGWPRGGELKISCRNVGVLKFVHEQYPNIPVVQVPSTATAVAMVVGW